MPIDPAELAKLIESQAGPLRLWVRSRGGAGEDIVQEAFCRLVNQERAPENPVAWLYRVCRNLAESQRISERRRRQRERTRAELASQSGERVDPTELAETLATVEQLD